MDSVGRSWYAYVTDEQRGQLAVIDLRRLAVVSRVAVGRSPMGIVVGDLIWVTHGTGEPFITALALNTSAHPKVVDRIPSGGSALAAAPEADSLILAITYATGRVGAVDAGTHLLLWRRQLPAAAYGLAADFLSQRSLWVTSPRNGTTMLLSARSGRVLRTLTGCPGAHGVALVGAAWVVVACHGGGTAAIYSTRTWQRTLVPIGRGPESAAAIVGP
jgi:YVTN family beta-propeller protein